MVRALLFISRSTFPQNEKEKNELIERAGKAKCKSLVSGKRKDFYVFVCINNNSIVVVVVVVMTNLEQSERQ